MKRASTCAKCTFGRLFRKVGYCYSPTPVVRDSDPCPVCMCVLGMGLEFGIPLPPEFGTPSKKIAFGKYSILCVHTYERSRRTATEKLLEMSLRSFFPFIDSLVLRHNRRTGQTVKHGFQQTSCPKRNYLINVWQILTIFNKWPAKSDTI